MISLSLSLFLSLSLSLLDKEGEGHEELRAEFDGQFVPIENGNIMMGLTSRSLYVCLYSISLSLSPDLSRSDHTRHREELRTKFRGRARPYGKSKTED